MLQFKSIVLRAVEPEDLNLLYAWENNVDFFPYNEDVSFYSRAQMEQFIIVQSSTIYEIGQQRFIIENKDKIPVGAVDLFEFNERNSRVGVGILIEEKFRGQGYAKHSLECVLSYCFNQLFLHQVFCEISMDNKASLQLFRSIGFTQTGEKQAWRKTSNGFVNVGFFQKMHIEG